MLSWVTAPPMSSDKRTPSPPTSPIRKALTRTGGKLDSPATVTSEPSTGDIVPCAAADCAAADWAAAVCAGADRVPLIRLPNIRHLRFLCGHPTAPPPPRLIRSGRPAGAGHPRDPHPRAPMIGVWES
ncbi:hypothetical protein GCM10010988_14990 [Cnuibacter physcomitrellae]|nr:hypothetical protein GCM10010988_14990 [Cnuibacter physcomitrellae]